MHIPRHCYYAIVYGYLFGLAACNPAPHAAATASTGAAPPMPATVATSADPRADITQAMRASLAARSYRSRIVTTSSSGSNRTMSADVVAPDRMHMRMEMDRPGGLKLSKENILVGRSSYVRVGHGAWQKDPMDMGDLMSQFRDPAMVDAIAQKAQVEFLGSDTVDGMPMLVYRYTLKDLLGPGHDAVSKLWIGATDHLQHQLVSESDFDPLGNGKTIHSKTVATFYDYGADIAIEPPAM